MTLPNNWAFRWNVISLLCCSSFVFPDFVIFLTLFSLYLKPSWVVCVPNQYIKHFSAALSILCLYAALPGLSDLLPLGLSISDATDFIPVYPESPFMINNVSQSYCQKDHSWLCRRSAGLYSDVKLSMELAPPGLLECKSVSYFSVGCRWLLVMLDIWGYGQRYPNMAPTRVSPCMSRFPLVE